MSGKAGSIGSIVLGAVLIVVGAFTGGSTILPGIMLVAGGALGLAFQPKSANQEAAKAQELNVSPASVGNPVPVVFGEARITPNWLRYELEDYDRIPVYAEQQSGGKGGGSSPSPSVSHYIYTLKWELGLCMGPIDAIGRVYSMPGEADMLLDAPDPWTEFGGADKLTVELGPVDSESLIAQVFKGSAGQTRNVTGDPYDDGLSYRNIAWAFMIGQIGLNSYVRTYQWIVRRLPKCIRDDGTTVTGIKTRGSADTGHTNYNQANPAAILYEACTNKVWGRGLSSDIFDEDSFIAVSEYFELRDIGMTLVVDSQVGLEDIIDGIYRHVKTLLTWDGEVYKLQCLLDPTFTHGTIITLNRSDLLDLEVSLPFWETGTTNELRAEYLSADRGYRPDTVQAQDLGNMAVLGGRAVTDRISLTGFAEMNLAQQQVTRILSEISYPFMTATWEQNRFNSHIAIGQVVRIVWDEFTTDAITTYWMVYKIEDGASDNENIKVTAIQDQVLFPVEGEEAEVTVPSVLPWERLLSINPTLVNYYDRPVFTTDPIDPVTAFELPAIISGGTEERTAVIGERMARFCVATEATWGPDAVEQLPLGMQDESCITGVLVDPIVNGDAIDRSDAGIQFTITNLALWGDAIQAANVVQTGEDDMWRLVLSGQHWVIVEDELIQVGSIAQVSGSTFRMRNFIRGRFGSKIRPHAAGTDIFYTLARPAGVATGALPQNAPVWFQAIPWSISRVTAEGAAFQPAHFGANDTLYLGLGRRPLPPEVVSVSEDSGDVTARVRPRFVDRGAGVDTFPSVLSSVVGSLDGMSFLVIETDLNGAAIRSLSPEEVFTPGTLAAPGYVDLTYPKHGSAYQGRIYSVVDGRQSVDYAEINV